MATPEAIDRTISDLSIAFPEASKRTDKELIGMTGLYSRMLEQVEDSRLQKAVDLICRKNRFWPRVSELLEAVDHIPTESPAQYPPKWIYTFGHNWEEVTSDENKARCDAAYGIDPAKVAQAEEIYQSESRQNVNPNQ